MKKTIKIKLKKLLVGTPSGKVYYDPYTKKRQRLYSGGILQHLGRKNKKVRK